MGTSVLDRVTAEAGFLVVESGEAASGEAEIWKLPVSEATWPNTTHAGLCENIRPTGDAVAETDVTSGETRLESYGSLHGGGVSNRGVEKVEAEEISNIGGPIPEGTEVENNEEESEGGDIRVADNGVVMGSVSPEMAVGVAVTNIASNVPIRGAGLEAAISIYISLENIGAAVDGGLGGGLVSVGGEMGPGAR